MFSVTRPSCGGTSAGQCARGEVRAVAKLLDRGEHAFARGRAHVRVPIEHARDRLVRNRRRLRDVGHRGWALTPRPTACPPRGDLMRESSRDPRWRFGAPHRSAHAPLSSCIHSTCVAPERVVQAAVDLVHALVGLRRGGVRRVGASDRRPQSLRPLRRCHRKPPVCSPLVPAATAPNIAAPRAGIWVEPGTSTGTAGDVGEQLHQHGALLGDAAAGDDLVDRQPVSDEVVDDPAGGERDRLEQRPVDLGRGRRERETRRSRRRGRRRRGSSGCRSTS